MASTVSGPCTPFSSLPTIGGVRTGAKYQFYATRDREIVILAAIEDRFWANFRRPSAAPI